MTTSREIVFVDQNVSDLHSLLAGLRPDVEPIVLTASERATAQIATALKGRDDLHAVHIVAHGSAGEVRFGAGALSRETLHDHAADLAEIGRALGESGDLLLWSCNTAEGERGAAFVDELAHLVAANVAAASGRVGAAARGGRWELDARSNAVDVRAPLTAEGMAAYQGVMVAHADAVTFDAIVADTGAADFVTSDNTLTLEGLVEYHGAGDLSFDVYLTGGEFGATKTLVGTIVLNGLPGQGGEIEHAFVAWSLPLGLNGSDVLDDGTYTVTFVEAGGDPEDAGDVFPTVNTQFTIQPNQPPVAADDADTVAEGAAEITVNVLTNDSDPDSVLTAASITAFSQGANGTVVYNNDGTFTYTHNGSETISDSFTYTIDDGAGGTDTATVNLTVTPVNDAPFVATAIPNQTSARQAFWQFQVAADAFGDVDGPALTHTATLGNGDPLPDWLTFDAATRTFSGTPPRDGDLDQTIELQVTASDGLASVSDTFTLLLDGSIAGLNQDSGGFAQAPFQFTEVADTYTTSNLGEFANALGGNDVVTGALGNDAINGNAGNDNIDGGAGQNVLHGNEGNDYIASIGNLNIAFGDAGADQLYFNGNQNQLFGGDTRDNDNDWLGVNGTNNALTGGFGDEVWIGASGNSNTLNGDAGNDLVFANGIGNYLYGGIDNDWLGVSGDFNVLQAQQGNDYVAATGNFNTLDGGAGNDTLQAGAHTGDRFVFHDGYGIDTIVNFARHGAGGSDVIDLNGFGLNFTSLQSFLSDVGGNAVITINAATTLTIQGVATAQLQDSDFLF